MSKTFKTTEEVYHYQDGCPPVFIAGKGVEIDYDLAVRLGLVKASKPEPKKIEADKVENKAVKPNTKSAKSEE